MQSSYVNYFRNKTWFSFPEAQFYIESYSKTNWLNKTDQEGGIILHVRYSRKTNANSLPQVWQRVFIKDSSSFKVLPGNGSETHGFKKWDIQSEYVY